MWQPKKKSSEERVSSFWHDRTSAFISTEMSVRAPRNFFRLNIQTKKDDIIFNFVNTSTGQYQCELSIGTYNTYLSLVGELTVSVCGYGYVALCRVNWMGGEAPSCVRTSAQSGTLEIEHTELRLN